MVTVVFCQFSSDSCIFIDLCQSHHDISDKHKQRQTMSQELMKKGEQVQKAQMWLQSSHRSTVLSLKPRYSTEC